MSITIRQASVTPNSTAAEPTRLDTSARSYPEPWIFPTRSIARRLFFTCWLVFTLHFATNTVREIYLALGIGDHFSFRVDEYAHMHPDLFEKAGYGWHIGNNPGASMLAAIPYALARPIIDPIVKRVQHQRATAGVTEPPSYNSPWPMAREFYKEAWRRGLDIKFGLAAFVTQALCMAPVSALGAVVMFFLLRCVFHSDKMALWLSLLYAFGTPVFFRTGYLNQNMMLGQFAFMGFVTMWNPGESERWSTTTRFFLGGVAGGTALLFDYSGVVLLLGLFFYGLVKRATLVSPADALRHGGFYVLGTLGPVLLLWVYQWKSFGHPFYPGQHWMPPVEWIELGYQGYGWPQLDLFLALAFDYRFGLFVSSPLLALALFYPLVRRSTRRLLPNLELAFILLLFLAFWVFFSGSNYTRLQFNTGIRYMAPMFPFLFVPAAALLVRLPRLAIYFIAVVSVTESWCLAMVRDVERGLGVLDPILRVFVGGFQLPALSTLSRLSGQYGEFFQLGVSPLPLFAIAAVVLYGVWSPRFTGVSSSCARSTLKAGKQGVTL
jgi:hypothetical protein